MALLSVPVWNWFSDRWLKTRQAAGLFFCSSLLVVGFTIASVLTGPFDPSRMSPLARFAWGVYGIAVPLAIIFVWVGMWRYWVRLDSSSGPIKTFWFAVQLLGLVWGGCLYCYCVYLPHIFRTGGDKS